MLLRIENSVPQRLKPSIAAAVTARLKPCPSSRVAQQVKVSTFTRTGFCDYLMKACTRCPSNRWSERFHHDAGFHDPGNMLHHRDVVQGI
jgi:hypothetical protein